VSGSSAILNGVEKKFLLFLSVTDTPVLILCVEYSLCPFTVFAFGTLLTIKVILSVKNIN
jgi:hypothetical protein